MRILILDNVNAAEKYSQYDICLKSIDKCIEVYVFLFCQKGLKIFLRLTRSIV
jgi:hypothetical protein